jgi:hypothetical protein
MSRNGFHRRDRAKSLQQAASTIFGLMGLMPFLIFVWIAYLLDAMTDIRVQVSLVLALAISILGFSVLVVTMRRTSMMLTLLVRVAGQSALLPAARTSDRDPATHAEPEPPIPPSKAAHLAQRSVDIAPAIGAIRELRDAAEAVGRRWRPAAERQIGRRVRVTVQHLDEPETGTISRVTADGLVLEQDGAEFGVLWRLITSIELDADVEPMAQPVG